MTSRRFSDVVTWIAMGLVFAAAIATKVDADFEHFIERIVWIIAIQNAALWSAYYGRWHVRSEHRR